MAGELQKVTTFGDEAVIEMQSLLLTFTDIKGTSFDVATKTTLDLATAMGTDLKSSAIQVGKALNDPVAGLTSLSRSGIQFNDSQKELIKSLVETGDKAGAQAIILKELNAQFGGAAEAATQGTGKIKQLNNSIGDVGESIGGAVANSELFADSIDNIKQAADLLAGNSSVAEFAQTASEPLKMVVKLAARVKHGFADIVESIGFLAAVNTATLNADFAAIPVMFDAFTDSMAESDKKLNEFFTTLEKTPAQLDKAISAEEKSGTAKESAKFAGKGKTNRALSKVVETKAIKETEQSGVNKDEQSAFAQIRSPQQVLNEISGKSLAQIQQETKDKQADIDANNALLQERLRFNNQTDDPRFNKDFKTDKRFSDSSLVTRGEGAFKDKTIDPPKFDRQKAIDNLKSLNDDLRSFLESNPLQQTVEMVFVNSESGATLDSEALAGGTR